MTKPKLLKIRCPGCHRLAPWEGNEFRPFCSEHCKSQDLGNWATGSYRIVGDPVGQSDMEAVENTKGKKSED